MSNDRRKFFAHTTRRHPIVGPFETREEAIKAAFDADPKAKVATSGLGLDGPYGDIRWTRRDQFEATRAAANPMRQISYEGDVWYVVGTGTRVNGKVYVHLSSTTRFRQQRNGSNPIQMCDWVPEELVQ